MNQRNTKLNNKIVGADRHHTLSIYAISFLNSNSVTTTFLQAIAGATATALDEGL